MNELEGLDREEKVYYWGLLALGQLRDWGFLKLPYECTVLGKSIFDQLDAEFHPTDRELAEFVNSMPIEENKEVGFLRESVYLMLCGYRDNRDSFYDFLEQEGGDE